MRAGRFVLIGLAAVLLGTAPLTADAGLRKGMKAGINMANLVGDDTDPTGSTKKSRMGGAAGAFVEIGLPGMLSIEADVLYSMKGAAWETGTTTSSTNLDYVEIPVLAKVKLPIGPPMLKPSLIAGPAMGILLGAKNKVEGGATPGTTDVKDMTKSSDLGIVVGLGFGLSAGPLGVSLEARYGMGLASIDDSGADRDIKTSGISVLAGIAF